MSSYETRIPERSPEQRTSDLLGHAEQQYTRLSGHWSFKKGIEFNSLSGYLIVDPRVGGRPAAKGAYFYNETLIIRHLAGFDPTDRFRYVELVMDGGDYGFRFMPEQFTGANFGQKTDELGLPNEYEGLVKISRLASGEATIGGMSVAKYVEFERMLAEPGTTDTLTMAEQVMADLQRASYVRL